VALAAVWSRETEVETEAESKPVPIANDGDRFALPTDGRQAAHLREKRRLLYEYLVAGPKVFFKSIRTISQELTISWAWDDPKGWSPRTIKRLLADLRVLGLWEPAGKRGSHGSRIRRIYKGPNREDGPSTARMALLQAEDGPSRPREDGPQGFVVEVNSKSSLEDLSQDHVLKDLTRPENRRVAPKPAREQFRNHLLTFDYREDWVDDWLDQVDRQAKREEPDYERAWDQQLQLDAKEAITHEHLSAVFHILLEENCSEEYTLTVDDVMGIAGWDPDYSYYHFQRAMDLLVSDQALHTDGERYWLAS